MPPNNASSRTQQLSRQQRVAERLGVEADQVAIRDKLRGGVDADLTSEGVRAAERAQRQEFASEADFVRASDVAADVGKRDLSVEARIQAGRRDDVEERAVEGSAEEAEFVKPADLDAEVGKRGVSSLFIPDERKDDVEQRAVADVAKDAEFVQAADLDAEIGKRGVEGVRIPENRRDDVERRAVSEIAADKQFVNAADLDAEVGKRGVKDVGIPESQRETVASKAKSSFADDSKFIKQSDVAATVTGSGVSDIQISEDKQDDVKSRVQSAILEDAGPNAKQSDVKVEVTSSGVQTARLKDGAEKDIAARAIDDQFSFVDVGSSDVSETDSGGFQASDEVLKEAAVADAAPVVNPEREDLSQFVDRNLRRPKDQSEETVVIDGEEYAANQAGVRQAQELERAIEQNETVVAKEFGLEPEKIPSQSDFTVTETDDGRAVEASEAFAEQQAAQEIDAESPTVEVSGSDVDLEDGSAALESDVKKRIATAEIDQSLSTIDVGVGDVKETQSGFAPRSETLKQAAAERATPTTNPTDDDLVDFFFENDLETDEGFNKAVELRGAISDNETIDPSRFEGVEADVSPAQSDFAVEQSDSGREVVADDSFQRELAATSFDAQFSGVDVSTDDLTTRDDGFGLRSGTQRAVAADQIESETGLGSIDPFADLTRDEDSGGFDLTGSARRSVAADQFQENTGLGEINPNTGLVETDDGFGLSTVSQRRLAADQFEEETDLSDVDPQQDILLNDDGSANLAGRTEQRLAAELLDQQVDADVGVDDIERVTNPDGDTEFEFEGVSF